MREETRIGFNLERLTKEIGRVVGLHTRWTATAMNR